MAKFIRSIGRCYVNGVGFDLYQNSDGSATIRPTRIDGRGYRKRCWLKFSSLGRAESFIESFECEGASLIQKLKDHAL